jgi:hypothetical protein
MLKLNCHVAFTFHCFTIQGLTTNNSSDLFLAGGDYPSWLAYAGKGPSTLFQVPDDIDRHMKGIILCVVYSSTSENAGAECLTSVLIINYTKCTIQIYKRDTVTSFNDEDWKGLTSNLEPGDEVEIFVAFGHELIVKETTVYLVYDQSTTTEFDQSIILDVESSTNFEMDPSEEVKLQSLPEVEVEASSTDDVKANLSPEVKVLSSLIMKMKPSPKPKNSIFTRLLKRMGACLCMKQHRGEIKV